MIYTLEYLEQEAKKIQGAWNGKDKTMMLDGDIVHDPEYFVNGAKDLEEKLQEVRTLIRGLGI